MAAERCAPRASPSRRWRVYEKLGTGISPIELEVLQHRIEHGLVVVQPGKVKIIFSIGGADKIENRRTRDALCRWRERGNLLEEALIQLGCDRDPVPLRSVARRMARHSSRPRAAFGSKRSPQSSSSSSSMASKGGTRSIPTPCAVTTKR